MVNSIMRYCLNIYQIILYKVHGNFTDKWRKILDLRMILLLHSVPLQMVTVVAGTVDVLMPISEHPIEKIHVHERYNSTDAWVNDIALVKVCRFIVTFTYVCSNISSSKYQTNIKQIKTIQTMINDRTNFHR